MKILPDYEHMEYRDVYTCRTYLTPCARAAAVAAWAIVLKLASQPWEVPSPAFSSILCCSCGGRAEW